MLAAPPVQRTQRANGCVLPPAIDSGPSGERCVVDGNDTVNMVRPMLQESFVVGRIVVRRRDIVQHVLVVVLWYTHGAKLENPEEVPSKGASNEEKRRCVVGLTS